MLHFKYPATLDDHIKSTQLRLTFGKHHIPAADWSDLEDQLTNLLKEKTNVR